VEAVSDDLRLEQARKAAIKGRRAKQILEDEVFNEAFDGLERKCIESWQNSRPDDTEARERAFRLLTSARAAKQEFIKILNDGIMAEADLAEANEAPGVIQTYTAG
jgi:hypothetical protein